MDENPARERIVMFAQQQVDAGSHYLKGGHGAVPGTTCFSVHVSLDEDLSLAGLSVHAASTKSQRCFGRYASMPNGKLLGSDEPIDIVKEKVKKYCTDNAGKPADLAPTWENTGLYPRRLKSTAVALGEDCREKRHFDCIGLIYWVLNQVAPGAPWMSHHIKSYGEGNDLVNVMGSLSTQEIRDGDIVWRKVTHSDGSVGRHIGFLSRAGYALQAEWESSGVVSRVYRPGDWGGVSRIKDEYLK